ncbi:hypothetical protein FLACOL7796_00616 [Flavobacterium collinsii]|uniref:Uncharacterized protein n=2 Tax=Flavobacterium collinsii TaxID=1114861 RepID=A0A9W4TGE4_9FLAO|nr:hypothetical protein FLACOL7796_00616 [Flavobacterium collinsii]CAI2767066.1 conserved protein of unknown function [Flavobacterium collinsii]
MKSKTAYTSRIYPINILLKVIFIAMLTTFPITAFSQDTIPLPLEKITAPIVESGTTGERYFGDLLIQYAIDPTGKIVVCTLYLATVFVGVQSLTPTSPIYEFDLKSGESTTSGSLSIYLNFSPLVSTLKADLTYSVKANNTSFPFKGDLVGWYIYE